jgi:hypothetical protein
MKRVLFSILLLCTLGSSQAIDFNTYFEDASLRIDYYHSGNFETEQIANDELFKEPYWGGSKVNLIDTFDYGLYKYEVRDLASGNLIFSKGYSTLFGEWTDTKEAKTQFRSFSESVILPFPKNKIKVEFFKRSKQGVFSSIYVTIVDPKDYQIRTQLNRPIKSFKVHSGGESDKCLDIVLLAEGYTKEETQKFVKDAQRFAGYLFATDPIGTFKDKINIWVVPVVSAESGTDIPGENIWKNTAMNSHFYTFGTERYINTVDNKAVRDYAANVPYDQIYILVNTDKYGGAGIYNYYSICTADHPSSDFVFTHEFGHAFAGLADEYYTSDVAVEGFYDLKTEPWEPNITTLVDFDSKWKGMVADGTPIPTEVDRSNHALIGAFEGAGYLKYGIYRPRNECSMKSVRFNDFCPVCQKAFVDMLNYYSN